MYILKTRRRLRVVGKIRANKGLQGGWRVWGKLKLFHVAGRVFSRGGLPSAMRVWDTAPTSGGYPARH